MYDFIKISPSVLLHFILYFQSLPFFLHRLIIFFLQVFFQDFPRFGITILFWLYYMNNFTMYTNAFSKQLRLYLNLMIPRRCRRSYYCSFKFNFSKICSSPPLHIPQLLVHRVPILVQSFLFLEISLHFYVLNSWKTFG